MKIVAEKGLKQFLLIHEKDIEKAGKFNESNEWSLLFLVFWDEFGRFPGKMEFGK